MVKKVFSLLLIFIVLFLSGCGNNSVKKVNPLDLGGKTYSQIIGILGKGHTEPSFYEGGVYISYSGGYNIFFDAEDTVLKAANKVTAVMITEPMDVYKGISIEKTLDEINDNKGLLNRLTLVADPEDGGYYATAKFKYNNKVLGMALQFDDCKICDRISIFFNRQDEFSKYLEI